MPQARPNPSLWRLAGGAGMAAACIGLAGSMLLSLVCWLPDAAASGSAASVMRAGAIAFLAAHHGGVEVAGLSVQLLPLGMLLVLAALVWRSGAYVGASVQLETPPSRECATPGADPRRLAAAVAVQTAGYLLVCAVASVFAVVGSSRVSPVPTLLAAAVVCSVVSGASAVRYVALPVFGVLTATSARVAVAVSSLYLGVGAVLVGASLAVHAGRVMQLSREVGGGISGAPIALLGALATPNAAILAAAYLAGPGFTIGTGVHFSALGQSAATLPAFPILGALPDSSRPSPVSGVLVVATMVLAGGVAATLVLRGATGFLQRIGIGVVAALAAGLLMGVLTLLAGGGVGTGRLATVGASAWQVAAAVAVQVVVVVSLASAVAGVYRWLAPGQQTQRAGRFALLSGRPGEVGTVAKVDLVKHRTTDRKAG